MGQLQEYLEHRCMTFFTLLEQHASLSIVVVLMVVVVVCVGGVGGRVVGLAVKGMTVAILLSCGHEMFLFSGCEGSLACFLAGPLNICVL